jgi:hypothetical protein
MFAMIKELFTKIELLVEEVVVAKDPMAEGVVKERGYDDLGDCAKSLYNLVVDNPNRFIVYKEQWIHDTAVLVKTPPIEKSTWGECKKQRGNYMKIEDVLTGKTIELGFIGQKHGFSSFGRDSGSSYNWSNSGFSDLVSREDWILLVDLLVQYNRKRRIHCHEAMVRKEQIKQKRYNKEMAKLYCVCEDKQQGNVYDKTNI